MYLCAWFDKKVNRVHIDNIGVDGKLIDLKNVVANIINKNCESLDFTHRGCLLNDDNKSLTDYEIKEDSEIHVFEKVSSETSPITYTDEELRKVSWELNVLARVHNFHSIAHKVMKNRAASIIREHVGKADNTAVAYLLHPELMLTLREPETLRKIAKKHPSIIQAASVLCEFIQAQTIQIQPTAASYYFPANNSSGDEEDMDSNTESSRDSHSPRQSSSVNTITPAQLAAAIASATNAVVGSSSTSSSTPSSNSNIITSEMFNNALQHAFNNTPSGTPPVTPVTAPESSLAGRYDNQLRVMHELGMTNDVANLRALHTTSGNLQQAIDLVLSGIMD